MVELTEISENTTPEPQVVAAEPLNNEEKELYKVDDAKTEKDDEDKDDDSEDDSEFEDDFNEDETIMERIAALKDIISPNKRKAICDTFSETKKCLRTLFLKGGNLGWALTTTALLLGVPLSLSILSEQQLIEMEKTFDLQKDANDLLGQGEETKQEQI